MSKKKFRNLDKSLKNNQELKNVTKFKLWTI